MPNCAAGLPLLCLTLLAGCASAPPSSVPPLIVNGCPGVSACRLPPSRPQTNSDLLTLVDELEAAWHDCAAQIDTIRACQSASGRLDPHQP
ncbi:Rz1-like lysis system protein LysC [Laribacter hongkongensis]|uniref:Rz1-like lysis system protein LysC n=1 Tax=Laribacter hongkongensis TaxID=168471 RepID=UPI00357162CE